MFRQHREQERLAEARAEEEALLYLQEAWAQGEILSSEPEGGWCDWERKEAREESLMQCIYCGLSGHFGWECRHFLRMQMNKKKRMKTV